VILDRTQSLTPCSSKGILGGAGDPRYDKNWMTPGNDESKFRVPKKLPRLF